MKIGPYRNIKVASELIEQRLRILDNFKSFKLRKNPFGSFDFILLTLKFFRLTRPPFLFQWEGSKLVPTDPRTLGKRQENIQKVFQKCEGTDSNLSKNFLYVEFYKQQKTRVQMGLFVFKNCQPLKKIFKTITKTLNSNK